jgi:hypothetical protein
MAAPDTLPIRLFLLGYDPRRERISGGAYHSSTIRAAALEDLRLRGSLVDDNGRVHVGGVAHPGDSILSDVLTEISASTRPKTWRHWVGVNARATFRAVRDQLEDHQVIWLEAYRVLGIFPGHRVKLRDLGEVMRLRAACDRALAEVGAVAPRDAAMVALAAAGELGTVLPGKQRRQHRARIAALSHSPVTTALRQVVQAAKSST